MRKTFLTFGKPDIREEDIQAVGDVLRSGWIGTGPKTEEFENTIAQYVGAKYAVATNSCTAALFLSLKVLGVGPGDEVIVPSMTFVATANVVHHVGATPVLVDCYKNGTLSMEYASQAVTPKTKAIIPVHLYGQPCNMGSLADIVIRKGLFCVEDCAHALETQVCDDALGMRHVGTFGDTGCFSFYVSKNITTIEGGMLVTDDKELADKARVLRLHGASKDAYKRFNAPGFAHYDVAEAGYKFNMTDVQAALGLSQFKRLTEGLKRREQIWKEYDTAFSNCPVEIPKVYDGIVHARHLYTLRVSAVDRDALLAALQRENIGVGVHYRPVHEMSFYKDNYRAESLHMSHEIGQRTLSLPLSPAMTDEDVKDVIDTVKRVLARPV